MEVQPMDKEDAAREKGIYPKIRNYHPIHD